MDIMPDLSTPSSDIRRKILDVAMDLITPKNINLVRPVLSLFHGFLCPDGYVSQTPGT